MRSRTVNRIERTKFTRFGNAKLDLKNLPNVKYVEIQDGFETCTILLRQRVTVHLSVGSNDMECVSKLK